MTIIQPGEYYACKDDRIIATLLGSCVAVCLRDEATGVCGMNHIMLPGDFRSTDIFADPTGRYGMFAMELLLGEMIKLGCSRDSLTAKIFGGGHVLSALSANNSVSEANIKFTKAFLNMEGIRIIGEDLGGRLGRKIMFMTKSGEVFVKKLASTTQDRVIKREEAYRNKLIAQQPKSGEVTIF